MDFNARIVADLDMSAAKSELAKLTKDQEMKLGVNIALKNADDLKKIQSEATRLQNVLSKRYSINIDNKQALKAANDTIKQIEKINNQLQNKTQSVSGSYWKQTFENQFSDRHSSNETLTKMKQYYEQQEKIANEAAKRQLQLQKQQQQQIVAIQNEIASGSFDLRNAKNDAFINKYSSQQSETLSRVRQEIETIKDLQNQLTSGSLSDDQMISTYQKLNEEVVKLGNAMKQVNVENTKTLSPDIADTSANKVKAYYEANTKAAKQYGEQLKQLESAYRSMTTQGEKIELDNEFKRIQSEISAAGLTGKSGFDELKRAATQIGEFVGIYGMLQNVIYEVPRKMVSNVFEVNDSMTNLKIATGVTNDSALELMDTYSQLGDQLKATSTDIAASATEWLKQGKSLQESEKLAQDSIILSKIGDLSSEDSTKTITAAMKAYNLAEDDVMNFIDQISAIDLVSATDVGGLAQAFNEVAANARQAGISTQELLSYAAAIGETTQEGMASVGTSLNAIFSRMGNIKLSRLKDYETGEDLSNVETVLRGVGIELRDSQDEFRNFNEVLNETASNWNSYSGVQQRAIAQAFSGTNHMNEFMVLMQQWDNVQKYIAEADNASGQSLQKYEAYTDSLQGKMEGFTNSFQSLSTATFNSNLFGYLIDGGTVFLNLLTNIVDAGSGLPALGSAITGILGANGKGKHKVIVINALFYKIA